MGEGTGRHTQPHTVTRARTHTATSFRVRRCHSGCPLKLRWSSLPAGSEFAVQTPLSATSAAQRSSGDPCIGSSNVCSIVAPGAVPARAARLQKYRRSRNEIGRQLARDHQAASRPRQEHGQNEEEPGTFSSKSFHIMIRVSRPARPANQDDIIRDVSGVSHLPKS